MLLVKLSNEYVMHNQGILDAINQHAQQLLISENVAGLDGTYLETVMNKISGTVSEMLVSRLPEMLNGATINQLEGYMNRFERRHEIKENSGVQVDNTKTLLIRPVLSNAPSLSHSSSFDSVLDEASHSLEFSKKKKDRSSKM